MGNVIYFKSGKKVVDTAHWGIRYKISSYADLLLKAIIGIDSQILFWIHPSVDKSIITKETHSNNNYRG